MSIESEANKEERMNKELSGKERTEWSMDESSKLTYYAAITQMFAAFWTFKSDRLAADLSGSCDRRLARACLRAWPSRHFKRQFAGNEGFSASRRPVFFLTF
mmetsp:Transcript_26164/g.41752  ORF Transcript_26164/g.41752 Transcript_26164/m.41752 type:complete len:102 (-) Transcript_26164:39-344(-)